MPDWAVKSLDNSTSAFAGSQAAQHKVSCLLCAPASPLQRAASPSAAAPVINRMHLFITPSLLAVPRPPLGHQPPPWQPDVQTCHTALIRPPEPLCSPGNVRVLFSNKRFTKQTQCQPSFVRLCLGEGRGMNHDARQGCANRLVRVQI